VPPPPLKPKHNHEKKKLKRKIERKFWKLSAPSQIVACPLRHIEHKIKKGYILSSNFFEK
jgi:hypothetical protein